MGKNPAWPVCVDYTVCIHIDHFNFPCHHPKEKTHGPPMGAAISDILMRTAHTCMHRELIFIDLDLSVLYLVSFLPWSSQFRKQDLEINYLHQREICGGVTVMFVPSSASKKQIVVKSVKDYLVSLESHIPSLPAKLANCGNSQRRRNSIRVLISLLYAWESFSWQHHAVQFRETLDEASGFSGTWKLLTQGRRSGVHSPAIREASRKN